MLHKNQLSRLKKLVLSCTAVLLVGTIYLIFTSLTGLGIPCIFRRISGIFCPGCGISRMFIALAHLDFAAAFGYNPFLFCLLPLGCTLFLYKSTVYVKYGDTKMPLWEQILYVVIFVLCIIFTVMRNMESFAWLRP